MGRIELEQRLLERRIWLAAILATVALFVLLYYSFQSVRTPAPVPRQRTPAVFFLSGRFQIGEARAMQAVRSPALIALPSRALSSGNHRPGNMRTDPKPSLDVMMTDFVRPQAPRNIGATLEEWIFRLQREQQRPPFVETPARASKTFAKNSPSWTASGGLSGLEADLAPLLQLGEADSLSGVFSAWLALNEYGRVAHVIVETHVTDKKLAVKLDKAFRECVFCKATGSREGNITIRFP